MSERSIAWPGAVNARDLGGLNLIGGGTTAFGRVFRSGRVEALTDEGWHAAIDAGLATIVDLRNADEAVRLDDDPSVDDALTVTIERVSCPVEDLDNAEFVERQNELGYDHPACYPYHLSLLPTHTVRVFRALAQVDRPVLFHCHQGRDRSGFVAALLLSLNGVTMDAIAGDYELAVREANEGRLSEDKLGPYIDERATALIDWLITLDAADYLSSAGMPDDELSVVSGLLLD